MLSRLRRASSRPHASIGNIRAGWIYVALFFATLAVYAQVRHFDFVNYDDPEYVTGNRHVEQGITPAGLSWALTSGEAANWFPVTRVSHMLDVQLFDMDSGMHHLVNALLHALATLLLFAFLHRATHAQWPSAFVAFLFALHPLHVESVAWIAERKDTLSGVFAFLTLWAYVRYTERPNWSRYLLVFLLFCLGLMSKPTIVTLPFLLLLLDVWPLDRLKARVVWEKIPLLVVSAAAAITTYMVQQSSRAVKTFSVFPLRLRIENALVSYGTYIGKMFWPSKLAVFYPYPSHISFWHAVISAVVIAGISVLVLHELRRRPYLATGWFWYVVMLLPMIGLIQVGAQARADRYTYLASVGLSIMLAWGGADLIKTWPRIKTFVAGSAAAACGACVLLTYIQIGYWRDSESLFAHALEVTKGNYVAHHNFGLAIADVPGRLPEAIAHYRTALEIRPDSVEARTDLGSGLAKMGQFEEAIGEYETALRLAPDCAICRSNLALARTAMSQALLTAGVALQKSGRTGEAIAQFEAALRAEPDFAEAHNDLGVALASSGRTQDAVEQFKAALRIKPDYADAQYNLEAATGQAANRSSAH